MADPEGVQGVRSNPPLELNYFIFMGNFRKNEAKLRKRNPFLNLNPLSKNPGSAPGGGGGVTCTKVTCMDPELFFLGGREHRQTCVGLT